jgi:endonuclease YncB( thermonuclease family)
MKKLIFMLVLVLSQTAKAEEKIYNAVIERVKDGDTIVVKPFLNDLFKNYKFSIRLAVINTPETDSISACEKKLAEESKQFTKNLLPEGKKVILKIDSDKIMDGFGRILADVIVDNQSVSELLLKNKLATKYKKGYKFNWCQD